jgi:hypothetical protein
LLEFAWGYLSRLNDQVPFGAEHTIFNDIRGIIVGEPALEVECWWQLRGESLGKFKLGTKLDFSGCPEPDRQFKLVSVVGKIG